VTYHQALHSVIAPERAELLLQDGVVLVADIYRPEGNGPWPVLLMRQPYGRTIASTVVLAHPSWYAAHGYMVVIQDVRGTGESGGIFEAFVNEAADGAATLEWAANLPGSNGKIGLYGFSYHAMTQYLAIAGGGRRPDAIVPAMGSWMPRTDWAYEGNAFRLGLNVGWATQMAMLSAAKRGDAEAYSALASMKPAELRSFLAARPDLSHLSKWLQDDAAYWEAVSPGVLLRDDKLDIPALHIGGWYDFLLQGTWAADSAFRARSPETSHLLIGPWTHAPWNRAGGSADMGTDAEISVDRAIVRFFDFYLKAAGERPDYVCLFDIGIREWHVLPSLPEVTRQEYFLTSCGLAAAALTNGRLVSDVPARAVDTFVSDPFRPTPLVGGHFGSPAGFADRSMIDNRADVAVYTSEPFVVDTTFIGEASAEIELSSPSQIFDLSAALSLVLPDGSARVISTGHVRLNGPQASATIALRPICVTIPAGYAVRLSLQGAAAPVFEVHPGSDAFAPVPDMLRKPVPISIHHGGASRSRLIMPQVQNVCR